MNDISPFNGFPNGLFFTRGEVEVMFVHQRLEYGHLVRGQGKTVFARLAGSENFHLVPASAQFGGKTLRRDTGSVVVGVVSIYYKENSHNEWNKQNFSQK